MQPLRLRSAPAARALSKLDVLAVVGTLLILGTIFVVMLPHMQASYRYGLSPRSICQSNLKGMGTAFYTYGNENNEMWPVCAPIKDIDEGKLRVT